MQLIAIYQKIFHFIADRRLAAGDLEARVIHTHMLTVITTGALMWGYAILAITSISHPLPGIIGIIASIVHLLSPLLYRLNNKALLNSSIMLAAGMAHQGTFGYFTGGFMGKIIIWFGVLPFLGAIIVGKRGAILWCMISFSATFSFLVLELSGHHFPDVITPLGSLIAQCYIAFGWIFLSAILSYAYLVHEEILAKQRTEQKENVENLFRVLCHDLGNPLALLQMGMDQAVNQQDETKRKRAFDISQRAVNTMVELTQNVRKMYALKEGKAEIQCVPMSLNAAVEQIFFLFQGPLETKKIKLIYDTQRHQGTVVLVDPISFLHQVVGNILSNAIKFSEPGGTILMYAKELESGKITLHIEDQGIGMPKELREKLFDVHTRTSRPGTSGERGTGFGMHLMKTFVEKYGGNVEVQSFEKNDPTHNRDHGTQFILTLRGNFA